MALFKRAIALKELPRTGEITEGAAIDMDPLSRFCRSPPGVDGAEYGIVAQLVRVPDCRRNKSLFHKYLCGSTMR